MSAPQFTPGPWSWDTEAGWDNPSTGMRDWCLLEGPEGDQGCSIFEGGFVRENDAENLANASLIAAAPEMFDALEDIQRTIRANDLLTMDPDLSAIASSIDTLLRPIRGEAA